MTDPVPRTPEELAEALLDAQVRFLGAALGPAEFNALLESEIDAFLAAAAQITLSQAVTREQIKAVAIKYAVAMRMPGSIPEIASEIADRIYNHPAQSAFSLGQVIPARHVEELTAKLLELPLLREQLLASPLILELAAETAYRIAGDTLAAGRRVPGISTLAGLGGQVLHQLRPDAGLEIEAQARAVAERVTSLLLRRIQGAAMAPEDPWLLEAMVEIWREQSHQPVAVLREMFSQEDLEEILVMVYDLWLSLRETPWLHALIDEGVDFFFDQYSATSLLGLLQEFGISRADLIEEGQRFAPRVLALVQENGMLEAFLRRRLEGFFASPEALALLARPSDGDGPDGVTRSIPAGS